MTSDESALRAAIWASPHDDTPRLVYADWLDEHGQPERAEFIRVQCELIRTEDDGPHDSPHRVALQHREKELLRVWVKHWRAGFPVEARRHWRFRRGFPIPPNRCVPVGQLVATDPALWAIAPVCDWQVFDTGRQLDRLLRWPHRDRLSTVYFHTQLPAGDGWGRRLAGPDGLRNACSLYFIRVPEPIPPGECEGLLSGPAALAVQTINATESAFGLEPVRVLTDAPTDHLRWLQIDRCPVGDAGVRLLAGWPSLARVRYLSLWGVGMTDLGAEALAESPHTGGLRVLELSMNRLTPRGAQALARSAHLKRTCIRVHSPEVHEWSQYIRRIDR